MAQAEFCRFGNHSSGFIQAHMLGLRDFMWRGRGIKHQTRLRNSTVIERSGEGLVTRILNEKMQDDAGERGIEGMAVPFPIAALAIHLDIAGLFPGFFELDDSAFEVGSGLAVPLTEVQNLKRLAVRCVPFHSIFAVEEAGLNFNFPLADEFLMEARGQSG
jgi:hypothetical protein